MPADEMPDDIAALLRDRPTDASAPGAQSRLWTNTAGRGSGPGRPDNAAPATVASIAMLAGFAAGALCGILGTYLVVAFLAAPPEVHVPVPAPEVRSPQMPAAVAPTPVARTPVARAPVASPRIAATPAPVAPAIPVPSSQAMERAWLDAARTALSRNDVDGATSHLERALARFPDGALREEREALAIHVLLARGDRPLARLAIDTFRERHPGSLFLLAIEDAMRELEATR